MNRSWVGWILLLVLLAVCIGMTVAMTRIHEPIEADLKQAADWAMKEDWIQAAHFFREAEARWTKWEHFRTGFADHNPVEEIDASFAMLKVYGAAREGLDFSALCKGLARKVAAVGEAHAFTWWNLL